MDMIAAGLNVLNDNLELAEKKAGRKLTQEESDAVFAWTMGKFEQGLTILSLEKQRQKL